MLRADPEQPVQERLESLWNALSDDRIRRAVLVAQVAFADGTMPVLLEWCERIIDDLSYAVFAELLLNYVADPRRVFDLKIQFKTQSRRDRRFYYRLAGSTKRELASFELHRIYFMRVMFRLDPAPADYTGPFWTPPVPYIRLDGEQGRLATGIHEVAGFRLWAIGRHITRGEQGSGVVRRQDLFAYLKVCQINYSKRHFNRLLARGVGLFWYVDDERIFLRSTANVSVELLRRFKAKPTHLDGNLPGVREVLIDPSGSIERFEAMLYAGWLAGRSRENDITIARETLAALFRRDPITIRRWERTRLEGIVTTRTNYAQCADVERYYDHIPYDYNHPYRAKISHADQTTSVEIRLRWQLPNTYHSTISTYAHVGQAAKVRREVLSEFPAERERGGYCRRYFTCDTYQRRSRSAAFRMGLRGDVNRPVYVYLGDQRRTGHGIFEITNSGHMMTAANEQVRPKKRRGFLSSPPNPLSTPCVHSPTVLRGRGKEDKKHKQSWVRLRK